MCVSERWQQLQAQTPPLPAHAGIRPTSPHTQQSGGGLAAYHVSLRSVEDEEEGTSGSADEGGSEAGGSSSSTGGGQQSEDGDGLEELSR